MASSLNSVCFSLLDSGFPLKYLLAAVSAVVTTDGEIIVNANDEESKSAIAFFTIVFDSIECKIVSVITEGNFTFSQFQQSVNACKETAQKIFNFYRSSIQKQFIS
jgi:ribonuclease PH